MADKPIELNIEGQKVLIDRSAPPKPLNRIMWTKIGADIQLDLGYFDLAEMNIAIEKAKKDKTGNISSNLYITDRFVVSPSNATILLKDMQDLVDSLRKGKVLPEVSE